MEEFEKKKKITIISIVIIIIVVLISVIFLLTKNNKKTTSKTNSEIKASAYKISGNSLEDFDLYFLQLENAKKNKVYSPLSIKYALEMLEEGTNGQSKKQISNIIGQYKGKKYINNENMSFANAVFIKESYKDSIKENYVNTLKNKYNAEVIYDSLKNTNNINSWISNKTLNLINNALSNLGEDPRFILVNALGIDMEWEEKFLKCLGGCSAIYSHEKFSWYGPETVTANNFNNDQEVAGMKIIASLNNYDIVNELKEDKIREIVGNAYREYLVEDPYDLNGDLSEENINKVINEYLDKYIEEINSNYKRINKTTDFSLYVDDNIKAFAKDLKEYNGTTIQYVAIMPQSEELDSYIKNINASKINEIINKLKNLKNENFKNGVITKITGFIPKFKFDYSLNFQDDLKTLGITDIFDKNKADITGITSEKNIFVEKATHKANIEFTQDGIKASATSTLAGGLGAGGFDYSFDVPIEEIDLTFDKPYMFIIRDKNSGEVWFTGTVYEPLEWTKDPDYCNANEC